MSINVIEADGDDLEKWDSHVDRSPQGGMFHQLLALRLQAEHAGAKLHTLVGYKGSEAIGVFPIFKLQKGPIPLVFSPPPDLRIPYLGPALLNMEKLKRRKADSSQHQFIEGCLEWINDEISPWYSHVRTAAEYPDLRPFIWDDCDVVPKYTYIVDLTRGEDDLLMAFSRDARSNVTGEYETEYTIRVGEEEAIRDIVGQVKERYESQGKKFGVPVDFVLDLYEELPDGQVRPYILSSGGEFIGGILALRYGDTVARWQGGVRTDVDIDLPANDLLDWAVMRDGMETGLSSYDLVGANVPRINRYKSKFNPELHQFYQIETGYRPVIHLAHAIKK